MINNNWKRTAVGACTAAALVVGAGLAFAPAADAATTSSPTAAPSDLLGTIGSTLNSTLTGVLGTPTVAPSTTPSSPISISAGNGSIAVGVGNLAGVVIGSTTTGTTVTGTVTNPTGTSTGTTTTTPTGTSSTSSTSATDTSSSSSSTTSSSGGSSSSSPTSTPIMLTALSAVAQYKTVYPAKDGYRDTVDFTLNGTTSDGAQHAASGIAKLTFGSSVVTTWPITSTNQVINWNGLKGGRIVPGRYVFTAIIGDGTDSVMGTDAVDVSAQKLASATTLLTTKSVSGTHRMSAKPLAGLSKGKVTLRISSVASKVKGKQYLVFKHAGKSIRIRILNGKHTSKAVTIPKSFTTYTISHTWKKGTVKITSLKYRYSYKALK